jgi:hypothetical protein
VCSTQVMSSRASCTALWITKPAGLTGNGESMILLHCWSTFTSEEAVISSNISPYGLIRKWCSGPGMRAVMWVNTRSLQPYIATSR